MLKGTAPIHLHILEISDPHRDEMVLFRDFLRSNPNIAEDYAALKRDLAEQFAESRSEYIQRKDPVHTGGARTRQRARG